MSMATIQQSIISRVQPGRFDDFLSLNGEAVKLHERLGVPGARVFLAGAAGESAGTVIFATEHPSMEAYAVYAEAVAADGEMQALLARLRSKDSPVVIEQQTLAAEIPLSRTPKPTRGTVVEVHASRATPGRLEDVMAMGRRVCDFVEANGATNARSFQLTHAGLGTGTLLTSWEFSSLRAWGKATDAWETEAEGQSIAIESAGAGSPVAHVFSAVYSEIPI
jgi:hypothetical protein